MVLSGIGAESRNQIEEVHLSDLLQSKLAHVPLVHEMVEVVKLAWLAIPTHVLLLNQIIRVDADDLFHQPWHTLHTALHLGFEHPREASHISQLGSLALGLECLKRTAVYRKAHTVPVKRNVRASTKLLSPCFEWHDEDSNTESWPKQMLNAQNSRTCARNWRHVTLRLIPEVGLVCSSFAASFFASLRLTVGGALAFLPFFNFFSASSSYIHCGDWLQ